MAEPAGVNTEKEQDKKKLGIIVGHESSAQGAPSPWLGTHEYPWNSDLAQIMMAVETPLECRVFFRDGVGIRKAYAASDAWGSDVTVELHFNYSDNENAHPEPAFCTIPDRRGAGSSRPCSIGRSTGCSVSANGHAGEVVSRRLSRLQVRRRRGQTSLAAGRAPATLLEPFFGTNESNCAVVGARKSDYAAAIIRAAERMLL